jgi:AcrR family transcriptional regulator
MVSHSKTPPLPRRRGAPPKGERSARDRILETAADLFYRQGIQVTGVDTLVDCSGISKTSLYRTFRSKDEIITTVLDDKDRAYWQWWDSVIAKAPQDPRAQLRAILSAVARHIGSSADRGCPFLNAAVEIADLSHPARARVTANKAELRKHLAALCQKIAVPQIDRRSDQLAMLVNGAYATGLIDETSHVEADLIAAASSILATDLQGAPTE